jgi:hypothetical protein
MKHSILILLLIGWCAPMFAAEMRVFRAGTAVGDITPDPSGWLRSTEKTALSWVSSVSPCLCGALHRVWPRAPACLRFRADARPEAAPHSPTMLASLGASLGAIGHGKTREQVGCGRGALTPLFPFCRACRAGWGHPAHMKIDRSSSLGASLRGVCGADQRGQGETRNRHVRIWV